MRTMVSKSLSLIMSLALVLVSFPASAAPMAVAGTPDFVTALTPSANLGHIESFYKGSTEKPVVLIQDLHANFGVQKKIRSILEFLQPKVAPTGRPMVLGIEGAWGDIDLTGVRATELKTRKATADYLLKESEISAMEHFAALSETPVNLVGIDNPEDYIVHSQLFRKSLAARLSLAQKTDKLRETINDNKSQAPKDLRRLWRLEEDFHAGKVDLATVAKKLDVKVSTYKEAEIALSKAKATIAKKEEGDKGFFLKNMVEADQNLSLLGRLLRQQLTMDEVQWATQRVPAMLVTVRALLPGDNMNLWSDTIRAAIDHYAIALVRDQPMAEHALELAQKNAGTSVVMVTGGFHTAGITDILKSRKLSYVVIAPIVESHTLRDEQVYVKRMMDIHVTNEEIASAAKVSLTVPTVNAMGAIVTRVQGMSFFPNGSRVWNRVMPIFQRGAVPTPSADADQIAAGKAVDALVQNSNVAVPGLLAGAVNAMRRWTSQVRESALPQSQAADAASVPLQPVATSSRKPVIVSALTTGMVLGSVAIANAAQSAASNPAVQKIASQGIDSTTVGAAVAVTLAGAAAWAFGPKSNREKNVARVRETAKRMAIQRARLSAA